jgi:hypothetical protein
MKIQRPMLLYYRTTHSYFYYSLKVKLNNYRNLKNDPTSLYNKTVITHKLFTSPKKDNPFLTLNSVLAPLKKSCFKIFKK